MFDVGLIPLFLETSGIIEIRQDSSQITIDLLLGQGRDEKNTDIIDTYLEQLQSFGFLPERQGIWFQTEDQLLAASSGSTLFSSASLTKAATTLAVLHHYDLDHQFETQVEITGPIKNGVLTGDLIIQGGIDLLFMRPQGIVFGNQLESLGIRRIVGNLVVLFPDQSTLSDSEEVGSMLRESMNVDLWGDETQRLYQQHLPGVHKPKVTIEGAVKTFRETPTVATHLMTHQSPPLIDLLKYMNVHSNNALAEALVADMGCDRQFLSHVLEISGLPAQEVKFINGSGLGVGNQLSPRAAVGIFQAIQTKLTNHNLALGTVFPISGQDIGTLEDRNLPKGAVVKTGTLWNVSALAGYIPTQKHGRVWFAIMNEGGGNIEGLRKQQDQLLSRLTQHWSGD